ncbi:hypothetical protein N5V81_12825 [Escherichia coli]|nr:hypothetical protein [Escherichia coli]
MSLGRPRIIPLEKLQLPRGSIYHTIDLDQVVLAPPLTTPYVLASWKTAMIRHHFQLPEDGIIGHPRKKPVVGQERQIFQYHRNNRRICRMIEDGGTFQIRKCCSSKTTLRCCRIISTQTLDVLVRASAHIQLLMTNQMKADHVSTCVRTTTSSNWVTCCLLLDRLKRRIMIVLETGKPKTLKIQPAVVIERSAGLTAISKQPAPDGMDMNQLSRVNFIFTHNGGFTSMNMGGQHAA